MKKFLTKTFTNKPIRFCGALLILIAAIRLANAAELQEARVSQVIQDVRLLESHAAPHPAAVNDKVIKGSAVRTGVESRAELTFNDLTITRLGANTIFSFTAGARQAELTQGAVLIQVRQNAPPVRANTTAVTVAVMGGTAMLSTGPPTKFMVLEGTGTIYPLGHPEKAVTVHGGEMVVAQGGHVSNPEEFDVKLVLATSPLLVDFAPLANLPLIQMVVDQQAAEQQFVVSNLPPYKSFTDTIDTVDQAANSNPPVVQVRVGTPTPPPPTPPPTPSKFGTPSTITSPNPYVITSGTTITTDPSITTNGLTDFGKIYRGSMDDGPFTLWAFGSTSAFDTALHIDTEFFADPNHLPIAAFKFQNLSLTGNPTIDTSNNGVTKLGLIGVDGITSGAPGGTLNFTGLDLLVLATVNGSINLTSDVSFQNLNELAMYARGAGSNLTIDSPISNIGALYLAAEGSIQLTNPGTMSVGTFEATAGNNLALQIGGSLLPNGKVDLNTLVLPGTTVANGANVTLNITGDYTNNSTTDSSRLRVRNDSAHIGTGGNIAANIGGNLTAMNDLELDVQNTNGRIDNGGNISLRAGNINVAGPLDATLDNTGGLIGSDTALAITSSGALTVQGDATFQILNSDNGTGGSPGQINGSATIDVSTSGDFSANSLNALINDRHGGAIGGSAFVAFNIGGTLSTTTDATLGISTRNDGTGGGTIGSDATVGLTAGSISVGGAFTTFVSTNGGGSITGNASNLVGATGDMVVHGPIDVTIGDTGFNQINPPNFIAGGHIGGNATLTLAAQNITTSSTATGTPGIDTMALEASIYTNGQGTIGGNAIVDVLAAQNISAPGTVFFTVANGNYQNFGPGTIGGDAQVNVTAGNLSTGALFDDIYNYGGGSIGRDAMISLNLSNSFTATGNAEFKIFSSGGHIARNASINVTAGDISAPSLTAEIDNSTGGNIGGSANISLATTGNFTTSVGDATFTINNTAGTITNSSNLALNAGGSVSTAGELNLLLENYNETANPAGHIGGSANVSLTTGGNLTADFASIAINNRGGGMIDSGASLTVDITGALTTLHDGPDFLENTESLSVAISTRYDDTSGNTQRPVIGGDATLNLHADSASIGGSLGVFVGNRGGTIGGNALLNFNITHDVTVTGTDVPMFSAAADIELLNDSGSDVGSPFGGTIHGDATLQVSAANFTLTNAAGSLFVSIDNRNGGVIDSNATLSFNLSGNLTTQGAADIQILNNQNSNSNGVPGGSIGSAATLTISAADISIGTDFTARILNHRAQAAPGPGAGSIGTNAILNINAGSLTTGGAFDVSIFNRDAGVANVGGTGGSIGGNATINFNLTSSLQVAGNADFEILNESVVARSPGGIIGGDAAINVGLTSLAANSLVADINNSNGGTIGGSVFVNVGMGADITTPSGAEFDIYNNDNGSGTSGGTISTDAALNVNLGNIASGPEQDSNALVVQIDNRGGSIGGNAMINFAASGNVNAQGNAFIQILNFNDGGNSAGTIRGNAAMDVSAADLSTAGFLFDTILNGNGGSITGSATSAFTLTGGLTTQGDATVQIEDGNVSGSGAGSIGGAASVNVSAGGDINAQGNAVFRILNDDRGNASGGGTIIGDATVNVSAANISAGGLENRIFDSGGSIGGNASLAFNVGGNVTSSSFAVFQILNSNDDSGSGGGRIGSDATINVSATNISSSTLNGTIDNTGASIGGSGNLNFNLTGGLSTVGDTFLEIDNPNGGAIGSNATINVNAATISTGDFLNVIIFNGNGGLIGSDAQITVNATNLSPGGVNNYLGIDNTGGSIGGNASVTFNLTGDITSPGQPVFDILNSNGGTIGGNATIDVSAANITTNSLLTEIDNTGGSIGASTEGEAIINMNVSNSATVTNDATVAIYGSDGAVGGAAININGGNYNVGGRFLSYIDGNGTITFDNATAHANVLKAGVFGANGVLYVGGGILSADSELKLYAPGSNGQLNFNSNVTLGGNAVKILAANSITIFNNIVVTINGPAPADVYTNNANYTGFGGNGTTTGTFAGAGANNPQPLANAPPFNPTTPSRPIVTRGGNIVSPPRTGPPSPPAIHVNNTDELLALLDGATVGPDGKARISNSKNIRSAGNTNRINSNALSRATNRIIMQQTRDSTREITRAAVRRL